MPHREHTGETQATQDPHVGKKGHPELDSPIQLIINNLEGAKINRITAGGGNQVTRQTVYRLRTAAT